MPDILGQTVGRYEVKEVIGEGAMATVYRAYDPEIDRSLALKVLKSELCVDDEYLSRFLREAKTAGALSHPNIVTVYDVGKIENNPYIIMELLQGRHLGELLEEQTVLPIDTALVILIQLARALDYAHRCGVIHRDIKPDNIVVLPDGETIKVADFGIARVSRGDDAGKTMIGSVMGTPRYMSPEQALGKEADGRADLFALGVVMYEMLSGRKAFDAENIGTLMTQITQQQPAPLQDFCPGLPAGLRQIIRRLLQKKPEKRFQTGAELATALGRELSALREQQREKKEQRYIPLKIRWALSMGAIVSVVLLISMSVVFTLQSRSMTAQAVDSGVSFARFIAIETAVPLLSEDWISLETFIKEAAGRDTFSYLVVTDRQGVVRGASNPDLVGQQYAPNPSTRLIQDKGGIRTISVDLNDGRKVFDISAPVLFQNTEVGKITIGLSRDGLDRVKSVTGWLMFALALVTISSVVLMLFIFGAMLTRPFRVLQQSFDRFRDGNFDTRISLQRNDEIGELFDGFNRMATRVQNIISGDTNDTPAQEITAPAPENQDKTVRRGSPPKMTEPTEQQSEITTAPDDPHPDNPVAITESASEADTGPPDDDRTVIVPVIREGQVKSGESSPDPVNGDETKRDK